MNPESIIDCLEANAAVFHAQFRGVSEAERLWRPMPAKWTLAEILCHLYDEERDDFRARLRHTLSTPGNPLPEIDPEGWVTSRNYAERNYEEMLDALIAERRESIAWLRSFKSPPWHNVHVHPRYGKMPARLFLVNWLAHDFLHVRQINALRYQYLAGHGGESLAYAGRW